jgi:hypothetical protein
MNISLIDNGLDSLEKGYAHLKRYEEAKEAGALDNERFYILKDATLAIQHGAEILFKYILKVENEILLYSDISKLKNAYKQKHANTINELFEAEGVHTISYRESIERIHDICNIPIEKKLKDNCIKVEKWRNSITHSGVILNEFEVSSVLSKFMVQLDFFFSRAIGTAYTSSPGKEDLDRAFNIFLALHGKHTNQIKHNAIERLIKALKDNKIKNVTAPGVFRVDDTNKAVSILQAMQGDNVVYGFDMSNMHCSGNSIIEQITPDGAIQIFGEDNNCTYQLKLDEMLVYLPKIEGNSSPLIFIYSNYFDSVGDNPYTKVFGTTKTQRGFIIEGEGEIWDKEECIQFMNDEHDKRSWRIIERFLSKGCACFMNVQQLNYNSSASHLGKNLSSQELFDAFQQAITKQQATNSSI